MLNARQRAFCEAYASCGNAAEAARRAGYSERTARSIGQRLLTKADICNYIDELTAELRAERIADAEEIGAILSGLLRDDAQPAARRIQAAAVMLKAAGSFTRPAAPPAPAPPEDPEEDESGDVVIRLPWTAYEPMRAPTHYEGEDGEVHPLTPPGYGLQLVLSAEDIQLLRRKDMYTPTEES